MLEALTIALTAALAMVVLRMAYGLFTREPWRIERLSLIGLTHSAWPSVLGGICVTAVAAIVVGRWYTPIAIAGLIAVKLLYVSMLAGYKRAGERRAHDAMTVTSLTHSAVTLVALIAT